MSECPICGGSGWLRGNEYLDRLLCMDCYGTGIAGFADTGSHSAKPYQSGGG
jgi:hypothetical protein